MIKKKVLYTLNSETNIKSRTSFEKVQRVVIRFNQ